MDGLKLVRKPVFTREGIRVVGENMELETVQLESLKLECFCSSWKKSTEVGKFHCSWKVPSVVEK